MPRLRSSAQVAAFLATKLVLWDQRALWLELLLRHRVPGSESRLQLPLRALVLRSEREGEQLPPECETIVETLCRVFETMTTIALRVRAPDVTCCCFDPLLLQLQPGSKPARA
jgi:hypothetical protein